MRSSLNLRIFLFKNVSFSFLIKYFNMKQIVQRLQRAKNNNKDSREMKPKNEY